VGGGGSGALCQVRVVLSLKGHRAKEMASRLVGHGGGLGGTGRAPAADGGASPAGRFVGGENHVLILCWTSGVCDRR
jgi:hypothetical protein